MMNVNLSLSADELELVNLSIRCNLREIQSLADSEFLDDNVKNRYRKQIAMIPRILDVLTNLQVKRMMYDCGVCDTVEA